MDIQIKSIHRSDTFDIIQTDTDFYYSPKADRANPYQLYLNQWCETIKFYLPNASKSEYWAYNLISSREVMHLYHGNKEIYTFEDRTQTVARDMELLGFHILNDRWLVVFEYCQFDKIFICRTHDILKKKNSQFHSLAELRPSSHIDIKCYSFAGEYILLMTSTHIAKISVAPDDGTGLIKLDYKTMPNNIVLKSQDIAEHIIDVSFNQVNGLGPSGTQQSRQINVYMKRPHFYKLCFHSIMSHHSFIGTINTETLENARVPNQEFLNGGVEYLAPDIAIHRPDLHDLTQYFTLLAEPTKNLSDVPSTQTEVPLHWAINPSHTVESKILLHSNSAPLISNQHPGGVGLEFNVNGTVHEPCLKQAKKRLIQLNIHYYEERKEQRLLIAHKWDDDGRFFTIICSKWLDKQWLIYQVDRATRSIAFMRIQAPANDTVIEIQPGGKIIISRFDLLRETVRVIEPIKTHISSVFTGIPCTTAEFIAKFVCQKKINY